MRDFPEQPPRCDHAQTALRHRKTSAGATTYGRQCLRCGACVEKVAAAKVGAAPTPPWDQDLAPSWQERCQDYWRRRTEWFDREREAEKEEFWRRYHEHLNSPAWAAIRRKVLRRANRVCEGCREAPPSHVHHLTYVRLGDEMLFDLVAVCEECHEKIHGRPIGGGE
jgi:hypothetical protein